MRFKMLDFAAVCAAALVVVGSTPAAAQEAPGVRGQVIDAVTRAPIPRAAVTAGSLHVETGADGRFDLGPLTGSVALTASAAGYLPSKALEIDAASEQPIEIPLTPLATFRETVDVVVEAPAKPATLAVRPREVLAVPGAAENVFRVLQTLPGVAATEEFGSRLAVRGGGPDQNITVMDGVEIHNPYRLFGLTSAFNPETVQRFELTAGAFDARYGDRLSSLLVIENRAGTESRHLAGTAGLSITDTNVILEGRLPFAGSGSWLVAGRRTYYDLVAERFVDDDLPAFADVQTKLAWQPRPGRRLTLFGLRSRESADALFEGTDSSESGALISATRNDLLALSFTETHGSASFRTTVAAYDNTDELDVDAFFRSDVRRSNAPDDDEAFSFADVAFQRDLTVRDVSLRQEATFERGERNLFDAGFELHRLRTQVGWKIDGDRNPNAANGSSVQGGVGLPDQLDSARAATRTGAWLVWRHRPSDRWRIEPGLRVDDSTANGKTTVSGRLAASVEIDGATRLRVAGGLYTQSPGYEKLIQADYFVDLSGAGPVDLEHERSLQGLVGIERQLGFGLNARAEVYYKKLSRLLIGRLETAAERAARLANYDFPQALAGSLPTEPIITSNATSDGAGRAYGFDVYLARAAAPEHRVSGWASYTYGTTERVAYGRTQPFDYDRRHAVSMVANWRVKRWLDLAWTLRGASGFPRTPVLGLRVSDVADAADRDRDGNRTERIPETDRAGRLVYTIDRGGPENLNSARLPAFFRLDFRATFRPRGSGGRWQLYLDVINATNRKNAGFISTELEYDPNGTRPRLVERRSGSIPFLPSFGVHFRF